MDRYQRCGRRFGKLRVCFMPIRKIFEKIEVIIFYKNLKIAAQNFKCTYTHKIEKKLSQKLKVKVVLDVCTKYLEFTGDIENNLTFSFFIKKNNKLHIFGYKIV